MGQEVSQWLQLAARWFHVVVGVYWIGQTALFSWLDSRLRVEAAPDGSQELWMVHSGGFYRVERRSEPDTGDRPLHWFKWEAAFTFLSGFILLVTVYYFGGVLVDPASGVSLGLARGVGVGTLLLGWVVYDLLWVSGLARSERTLTAISVGALLAVGYGLSHVLSGRAMFIHVGALMGTIMAANVWVRILPAQTQMVAAARDGRALDPRLAARAKQRSHHNTYMALPLIFLMVSNHFPTISYGHSQAWLRLTVFLFLGFAARWLISRQNRAPVRPT